MLLLLGTLCFLSFFGPFRYAAGSSLSFIGWPLWKSGEFIQNRFSPLIIFLQSKNSIIKENQELRKLNDELTLSLLFKQSRSEENKVLKEKLGRSSEEKRVLAAVIARPPQLLYDTLVIDAGSNLGIAKDDLVVIEDIAIGRVIEVYGGSSKVLLFSSPGLESPVLLGEIKSVTTAVGKGGGTFEAKIPRELEVKEGDSVYLSGISKKVFAVVESITLKSSDALATILFKNPVNLWTLDLVEVQIHE